MSPSKLWILPQRNRSVLKIWFILMLINISGSSFCGLWNILTMKFIAERNKYQDLSESWHLKPIFYIIHENGHTWCWWWNSAVAINHGAKNFLILRDLKVHCHVDKVLPLDLTWANSSKPPPSHPVSYRVLIITCHILQNGVWTSK